MNSIQHPWSSSCTRDITLIDVPSHGRNMVEDMDVCCIICTIPYIISQNHHIVWLCFLGVDLWSFLVRIVRALVQGSTSVYPQNVGDMYNVDISTNMDVMHATSKTYICHMTNIQYWYFNNYGCYSCSFRKHIFVIW